MWHSQSNLMRVALVTAALCIPATAWAHPGHGFGTGFVAGFVHPFTGVDHVLAMVAVGLLAARLGGRALWAVPASFMSLMAVGGAFGAAGGPLPFVETMIALSVVVFGITIALHRRWPTAAVMGLAGLFAVFHGYAHGAEMPRTVSALRYAGGFVLATGLLHLVGIAFGSAIARLRSGYAPYVMSFGGSLIALAGLGLLFAPA